MKIMGYEGITGFVVEVFSNKGNRKETLRSLRLGGENQCFFVVSFAGLI